MEMPVLDRIAPERKGVSSQSRRALLCFCVSRRIGTPRSAKSARRSTMVAAGQVAPVNVGRADPMANLIGTFDNEPPVYQKGTGVRRAVRGTKWSTFGWRARGTRMAMSLYVLDSDTVRLARTICTRVFWPEFHAVEVRNVSQRPQSPSTKRSSGGTPTSCTRKRMRTTERGYSESCTSGLRRPRTVTIMSTTFQASHPAV